MNFRSELTFALVIILTIVFLAVCVAIGPKKTDAPQQAVEKKESLFEVVEDYDQHNGNYQILRYKPTRSLWVNGGGRCFVKIFDGEVEVK